MAGSGTTKLFVGNIMRGSSNDQLREEFARFGSVAECDIISDYGFVHFNDPNEADAAQQALHDSVFNGQKLKVEKSTSYVRQKPGAGNMDASSCYVCGNTGHWAKNCPEVPETEREKQSKRADRMRREPPPFGRRYPDEYRDDYRDAYDDYEAYPPRRRRPPPPPGYYDDYDLYYRRRPLPPPRYYDPYDYDYPPPPRRPPPPGYYRPHPDDYRPHPADYRPHPDDYRPHPDDYRPHPDDYRPHPDDYRPHPDDYPPRRAAPARPRDPLDYGRPLESAYALPPRVSDYARVASAAPTTSLPTSAFPSASTFYDFSEDTVETKESVSSSDLDPLAAELAKRPDPDFYRRQPRPSPY